jgi:hypothetical protein
VIAGAVVYGQLACFYNPALRPLTRSSNSPALVYQARYECLRHPSHPAAEVFPLVGQLGTSVAAGR